MRSQKKPGPTPVDQVQHYYAVSASFTKGGTVSLRLTKFHRDPRYLTTSLLGEWDAQHQSTEDACVWLMEAVRRWAGVLAEQARAEAGQPEQMELPF